ncbi:MAG: PASTA domain-containing protein, partial [Clostridiales bacterium]
GYNNSNQGNDDDGIPYGSNQNKDGKKTKKYALITVGVLLLALLTGFLVSSLGDDVTNIVMKDYEGYTYDKAVEELTKSGWDENKIEREDVKSDEVEEGKIISQNIEPEMKLKESDTVKFKVSKGAVDNSIPDLKGLDLNEAKDQLIDLGVDTANIETKYQFSDDVEKDKVIKTEPGAGSNYKDGDKIIIYVSKGKEEVEETQEPEEELVNIPFVEGSTLKDAVSALEAKGLNVSVSPADAQNDAKVISQSPGGGQDVSEGSTVTLTVEASNTPEPEPTPKIIESTSVKVRLPGDIDDDDILLSYTITNNDTGDVFSGQADTTKDQYSPTYELVINDIPEGRYKIDYTFNNQSGGSDNFVAR